MSGELTDKDFDSDTTVDGAIGESYTVIGTHTKDGHGVINSIKVINHGPKLSLEGHTTRIVPTVEEQHIVAAVNAEADRLLASGEVKLKTGETRTTLVHALLAREITAFRSRKSAEKTELQKHIASQEIAEVEDMFADDSMPPASNAMTAASFIKAQQSKTGDVAKVLASFGLPDLEPRTGKPGYILLTEEGDHAPFLQLEFHWAFQVSNEAAVFVCDNRDNRQSSQLMEILLANSHGVMSLQTGESPEAAAEGFPLSVRRVCQTYDVGKFRHYVFLVLD